MKKSKEDQIAEHERLADHFAEESHKFEGSISDALSGLSEAHRKYASTLRDKGDAPLLT